ncbi:hypothetical protein L1049_027914 [Liquidambar formosana]|uniref:Uncharacterized protein n=1 Tax=Liquidambar formosana TaxID=63359 RepID=A0AAP0WSV0_LIQFO
MFLRLFLVMSPTSSMRSTNQQGTQSGEHVLLSATSPGLPNTCIVGQNERTYFGTLSGTKGPKGLERIEVKRENHHRMHHKRMSTHLLVSSGTKKSVDPGCMAEILGQRAVFSYDFIRLTSTTWVSSTWESSTRFYIYMAKWMGKDTDVKFFMPYSSI